MDGWMNEWKVSKKKTQKTENSPYYCWVYYDEKTHAGFKFMGINSTVKFSVNLKIRIVDA